MKEARASPPHASSRWSARLDGDWHEVGPREAEVTRAQRRRAPGIRAVGPGDLQRASVLYHLSATLIWNGIKSLQRERGHQEWPS